MEVFREVGSQSAQRAGEAILGSGRRYEQDGEFFEDFRHSLGIASLPSLGRGNKTYIVLQLPTCAHKVLIGRR
ncbi:hypothetical protein DPMN_137585 [Dreissena polymorpha]|uniref:Uncharacterized protein n=1 Tax=Dreissena polymorpha TaxID=45954 RepID=A0A9D4JGJ1_DREPO|nr:hypothetical protein DPMN_137585 [Dreissena polymorpha]